MEALIVLIVTLLLVAVAWKIFSGLIKTVVLVIILVAAALFVFGGIG
ncbi:hypothetical protein V5740_03700 [Croceibacterium sp. TMG7-5b_MA50]